MASLGLNTQIQESLDRSEESFRLLVESVQDYAIFMLNPGGYIISWNIGAERIKGYKAAEIIGQHFGRFYCSEDIERGKPQQELKLAENYGRIEDEGWRVRKDGSYFWANVVITALRDNNGHLCGFAKVTRDMTERKMAEELRTSHSLVNAVIEGISDAIFVKDIQGNYLLINSAGANFIGKQVADIIGKKDTELFAPDSAQKIIADDRHILCIGASRTYEETVTASGITKTYSTTKTPYLDEKGNTLGILGISRDISESKRAEAEKAEILAREQLARKQADESLALLDTLLASAPVGLAFFDKELRCLRMNQYIAGVNGVSLTETIGRTMQEFLPEFANQVETLMRQVLDTGEAINNIEISGETKATERGEQHALANYYPVYTKDGEILGIGVAVSDITHLKRTEKKLRDRTQALSERTQRLQLLSETTSELLSSEQPLALIKNLFAKLQPLGLDTYFNYLVDEQRQMLHLASAGGICEELAQEIEWLELGQKVCGTVALEGYQMSIANIQQITDEKTELVRSIGIQTYSCQPLRVRGKVKGTLSFGSRSRSSLTAEEIALLQTICDQIAIAMHRSELMASLQRQTEQLQQANRMKDDFLAIVSHELRSPLNGILGWSIVLRGDRINEATKIKGLETIERNAKLQTQLIEDLLDVSRIITGKLKLKMESLQIAPIVQTAIESVRPVADAKQIQLECLLDPRVETVKGDLGRLQQVIWNLLSNAIKFTPTGGRIQVQLDRVNSHVEITVSDTGIGIEAEFLPFVFERFRQADATITRAYGGLGLGLAIVYHIVELHGGTVRVESAGKNQGAKFTVNLPSEIPVLLPGRVPQRGVSNNNSDPFVNLPTLAGLKVLIVDDEADTLNYQTMVLSANGADVKAVTSAAQALEVLRQWQPDVLLSDLGMPLEDGYSLLQKIRALPACEGGQIPSAALTAYVKDEERQQALNSGFQLHLSKPIEPTDLVKAVANLAGRN
ncbi:MAG: PAS domain S-box protein [Nostoc sp. ChiSLP02]|nr:PAS domain S-box protein [Nostoc sp. DedSLP05]MDZ8098808.1 PAS domain S-box protein [Nostoc sp. DedSLP01]MDZ8183578.1 PAS domain S-box protein [Nostoc sp. ChiSLP02]